MDSELGEIQVIPLGNSYSVKAGDMVIGVGAPAGMVHFSVYGAITYVARNVPVTDGVSRILFTDLTSNGDAGTFILNLNGEMIGWTDNSLKGENSIVSESVMSISDYKGILEKMTNGAETAYFGIKGQEVSETMQAEGIPKGVYITDAVSGDLPMKRDCRTAILCAVRRPRCGYSEGAEHTDCQLSAGKCGGGYCDAERPRRLHVSGVSGDGERAVG